MRTNAALLIALLAAGCGGSEEPTRTAEDVEYSPEDDALFGGAPVEADVPDPEAAEEAAAPSTAGPTEVAVEVKLGGEAYPRAEVEVQNPRGETVQRTRHGETITLPAGDYELVARVTSGDDVIGAPVEGRTELRLEGQAQRTAQILIPVARVRLNLSRGGRPIRGNPQVTLFREGQTEPVTSFRAGDRFISIVPGRYEADVRVGVHDIRVRGLTFMEGAEQTIPVNVE